jgi:hypothetical protein
MFSQILSISEIEIGRFFRFRKIHIFLIANGCIDKFNICMTDDYLNELVLL